MTSWLADQMMTAFDHSEKICPHNGIAIEDPQIDIAVQLALESVRLFPADKGFPGVRVIYPCADGLGYIAEQIQGPDWVNNPNMHQAQTGWCGRCATKRQTTRILYVPAGMSIVAIELCADCTRYMGKNFSPLKWIG